MSQRTKIKVRSVVPLTEFKRLWFNVLEDAAREIKSATLWNEPYDRAADVLDIYVNDIGAQMIQVENVVRHHAHRPHSQLCIKGRFMIVDQGVNRMIEYVIDIFGAYLTTG